GRPPATARGAGRPARRPRGRGPTRAGAGLALTSHPAPQEGRGGRGGRGGRPAPPPAFPLFGGDEGGRGCGTRGGPDGWGGGVGRLEGSAVARARLRAVLEALAGGRAVAEVCLHLGVSERHFRDLRDRALQAALAGLEPRPAGRPPRPQGEPDGRVAELEGA